MKREAVISGSDIRDSSSAAFVNTSSQRTAWEKTVTSRQQCMCLMKKCLPNTVQIRYSVGEWMPIVD